MSDEHQIPELFRRMADGGSTGKTGRWHAQGGKLPYQAMQLARAGSTSPTLRIHYSTGDIEILRYNQLTSIVYIGDSGALTLSVHAGAVCLAGRRLDLLLDGLEQQKIERINAYLPDRHTLAASDDLVIDELLWTPTKNMPGAQS